MLEALVGGVVVSSRSESENEFTVGEEKKSVLASVTLSSMKREKGRSVRSAVSEVEPAKFEYPDRPN